MPNPSDPPSAPDDREDSRPAAAPRPRRRKLVRALTLTVVVMCGLYLFRVPLFGGLIAREIEQRMGAALGGSFTVEGVEGSFLGGVTVLGLRTVTPPPVGALRSLAADRVDVRWSTFDLLDDPVAAVTSVVVTGARVELDLTRPAAAASTGTADAGATLRALPADLPPIDVQAALSVRTGDGEYAVGHLTLRGAATDFDLGLDDLRLPSWMPFPVVGPVTAHIARPTAEEIVVTSGTAIGGVTPRRVELRAPAGTAPALAAELSVAGAELNAGFQGGGVTIEGGELDLARLPTWMLERITTRGAARPAGRVRLSVNGRIDPASQLECELSGADLVWSIVIDGEAHAVAVRSATVRALIDDGAVSIASAVLDAAGARVELADLRLDSGARFGVASCKSFTVACDDVRATAADFGGTLPLRLPAEPGVALRCAGALSAPARLDLTSLVVTRGGTSASMHGSAELRAPDAAFDQAALSIDGTATLTLEELEAALPGEEWPRGARGTLHATCHVEGTPAQPSITLDVDGAGLHLFDRDLRVLSARAQVRDGDVQVERLHLEGDLADVDAQGRWPLGDDGTADFTGTLLLPDAKALRALLPAATAADGTLFDRIAGRFEGSWTVRGDVPGALAGTAAAGTVTASVSLSGDGVGVDGLSLGRVALDADLTWPKLTLRRLESDGPSGRVSTHGTADLATGAFDAESLDVVLPDLRAVLQRVAAEADFGGAVHVTGSLHAAAAVASWRDLSGALEVSGTDVHTPWLDATAVSARTEFGAGDIRLDDLDVVTPDWTAASAAKVSVAADGSLRATVERLRFSSSAKELGLAELAGPTALTLRDGGIRVERLDARVLGGTVRGSLSLGKALEASLEGDGIELSSFFDGFGGVASFKLAAAGDPEAPRVEVTLDVPELSHAATVGHVSVHLLQDTDGVHVDRLDVRAGTWLDAHGHGTVPIVAGRHGIRDVEGAQAGFELTLSSDEATRLLDLLGIEFAVAAGLDMHVLAEGARLEAQVTTRDARLTLEDGVAVDLDGATVLSLGLSDDGVLGTVRTDPAAPLVLEGDLRTAVVVDWSQPRAALERLREAPISGVARVHAPDVGLLSKWIGDVDHLSGRAHAEVTVAGTLSQPTWTGAAAADDVLLRLAGDVPAIAAGHARVSLVPGLLKVTECSAQMGYAPVSLTGTVKLPPGGEPVLDLSVHGSNALVVRSPELRLRADVDATVRGTPAALRIGGETRITDALYTRPIRLFGGGNSSPDRALQLFALRGGMLSTAQFDLRVRADESIRLETELLAGAASADLRLRGTGAVPLPEGRIDTRSLRVNLPLSSLDVTQGSLIFAPESPFDPRMEALAETRMQGYDLDVHVTGTLFDSGIHVSSNPSLSQEDAIVLLTTGARPEDTAADRLGATAVSRAGTVLGGALFSLLSGPRDPKADSFFDRVSVEFGKEQSRSGASTIDAEFRLTDRWYLHAERDRYDDVNFGVLWRLRFR